MTPWTMGLNILYGIGIAAIFGLSIVLEQSGALSLAYVLGVLLFVFDLFGPLKALYGEASRLTVMNAALDRIEAVLDEPELSDNGKQHIPAQAQPGQPGCKIRQCDDKGCGYSQCTSVGIDESDQHGIPARVSVSGHHLQQYHHGKARCHGRRNL